MESCAGRVALVTGGTRGIGRVVALRLAAAGADVAIVGRGQGAPRAGRSLEGTLDELRAVGRRAIAVGADLAEPSSRERIVEQVESALGPVDILVNNAGVAVFRNVVEWSPDDLRAIQEVNVWAPWDLIRGVLPGMLERDRGWIVNVASGSARPESARPGFAAYAGTKAMLGQLTRCLAAEVADTGVAVHLLAPRGSSRTELFTQLVADGVVGDALGEPLCAMADAVLALATVPAGELPDGAADAAGYRSLDLLAALGRPVLALDGSVVPGYTAAELPQRIAEIVDAIRGHPDLREQVDNRD